MIYKKKEGKLLTVYERLKKLFKLLHFNDKKNRLFESDEYIFLMEAYIYT